MTKSTRGRKAVIQSDSNLQRITTRISKEAIEILSKQVNKAAFIDAAIKAVGNPITVEVKGEDIGLLIDRTRGSRLH